MSLPEFTHIRPGSVCSSLVLVSLHLLQVEVQSLLVAEVVGGAKTIAKKSSVKNINHLWEQVSVHTHRKWMTYMSEGRTQSDNQTQLPFLKSLFELLNKDVKESSKG